MTPRETPPVDDDASEIPFLIEQALADPVLRPTMLGDYRQRPPVDAPRVIADTPAGVFGFVLGTIIGLAMWFLIAVACGLVWR